MHHIGFQERQSERPVRKRLKPAGVRTLVHIAGISLRTLQVFLPHNFAAIGFLFESRSVYDLDNLKRDRGHPSLIRLMASVDVKHYMFTLRDRMTLKHCTR